MTTDKQIKEPDGYIVNGTFYKELKAVGNKVHREIFVPIPVYFKPPKCPNCGIKFKNNKKSKP